MLSIFKKRYVDSAKLFHSVIPSLSASEIEDIFKIAIEHHQAGRLLQAQSLCQQILQQEPNNADALHFLGLVSGQLGKMEVAVDLISQAIHINPNSVFYQNLALTFKSMNRLAEAMTNYQKTLVLNPHNLYAREALNHLIAQVPSHNSIQNDVYPDQYYQLAKTFLEQENFDNAIESFFTLLILQPDYPLAHHQLGTLFLKKFQLNAAVECFHRAIELKSDDALTYNNLGNALMQQGQFTEAAKVYQTAIAYNPNCIEAHINLASVQYQQNNLDNAIDHCLRVLQINPHYAEAYNCLGLIQSKQGKLQQAIKNHLMALDFEPENAEAHLNLSLLLLSLGQYTEAWQHWEYRYHPSKSNYLNNITPPPFDFPAWKGESLRHKSLVIWPEQGLGDEIQFCRYVTLIKQAGAKRITLVCKPSLKTLFQRLKDINQIFTLAEIGAIEPHDYWTFSLSLPLHCQTTLNTIPSTVPYLFANSQQVKNIARKLKTIGNFKVGICWRGNPNFYNDATRSPGIAVFQTLFKIPGIAFFTLQPNTREEFIATVGQQAFDNGQEINADSFEESVALIMNLDLVISSCTSVAHLAGALGKPVWIVLEFAADWRWLIDREDSPWYPTARLFRQKQPGNWSEVFERVEAELQIAITEKKSRINWFDKIGWMLKK